MASSSLIQIVAPLSLLSLLIALQPTLISSQTITCKTKPFFNVTYDNCNDLPTLNAVLHWTFDTSTSSLSVAFTAPPPTSNGWVAFALNPTGSGMVGAQALIAFKPTPSGPVSVSTYNIQSYRAIIKGPISYDVTHLSAHESDGETTIFSMWALPEGSSSTVNIVWQVGPVVNGQIGKHAFEEANLSSAMKLDLVSGPEMGSPAMSPGPVSGDDVGEASAPTPAMSGAAAAAKTSSIMLMVLGVFVVSLF